MRRLTLAFAVAAGLVAIAPLAQARDAVPAPTTAPAPAKPAKDDPNRMICTREHVVGSNRPQKICMTVAQRDAAKAAADRALDSSRSRVDPSARSTSGM